MNEDPEPSEPRATHRTLIVVSGVVLIIALAVLALWLVLRK